jgi:DNA-binding MarR family transcriptional regulator
MAEGIPSESVVQAWARLVKAQHKVLGAVEADLRKAGFPPLAWYDVLLELRREEKGLRQLEIEGRLLLAQHNVSRLVDRLEKANLARRSPAAEDGRGQLVTITEEGRGLLRRMWPVYRQAIERHVGQKLGSDGDAKTLARLLERLIGTGKS